MPEKTKPEQNRLNRRKEKSEKSIVEKPEINKKGNWSEDQQEKSYYYDDSYGYEIYNPDDEEED